ncbi:MAG: hypothetical protein ABIJ31_11285 [Pseudomonadota bacterium]
MKIVLTLGDKDQTKVIIARNWFAGTFTYTVDGRKRPIKNPFSPSANFSFTLKKSYEFQVGNTRLYKILIEHTRPLLLAGFRPHQYDIFVDDDLHTRYNGY